MTRAAILFALAWGILIGYVTAVIMLDRNWRCTVSHYENSMQVCDMKVREK